MKEDNSMSNLLKWFENDDLFFRECREGQRWQEYVGRYLNTKGVKVHVEDTFFLGAILTCHAIQMMKLLDGL